MAYVEGPVQRYLDNAAAKLPAPGGGSIAAMIGALGASMSSMVANFTIGKKKYADVQDEVKALLEKAESERKKLAELVDADVAAYSTVSTAYGMPKETDDEKKARSAAIKDACRVAMSAPMDAARSCAEVASVCERLVDIGNKNLITDVGVSVLAAGAALKAAALNVEINLGSIGDDDFAAKTREELNALLERVSAIETTVMDKVKAAIG
jgi:formiminotetrahydrofolate cyclodeaminase